MKFGSKRRKRRSSLSRRRRFSGERSNVDEINQIYGFTPLGVDHDVILRRNNEHREFRVEHDPARKAFFVAYWLRSHKDLFFLTGCYFSRTGTKLYTQVYIETPGYRHRRRFVRMYVHIYFVRANVHPKFRRGRARNSSDLVRISSTAEDTKT